VARAAPADELPIEDVPAEQHYTLIWYELFGIQLHLDFSPPWVTRPKIGMWHMI
jgi:hypothetical protein